MLVSDLEGSLLSVSSAHQSLQISNESLVSRSKPSFANISVTTLPPTKQDSSKDENSSEDKEPPIGDGGQALLF